MQSLEWFALDVPSCLPNASSVAWLMCAKRRLRGGLWDTAGSTGDVALPRPLGGVGRCLLLSGPWSSRLLHDRVTLGLYIFFQLSLAK